MENIVNSDINMNEEPASQSGAGDEEKHFFEGESKPFFYMS
jgi:hypothetical protein